MSISTRFAPPIFAVAALLASSSLSAALAYDDVPGVAADVGVVVVPGPAYGYAPVRPAARVYGYGPVYRAEPVVERRRRRVVSGRVYGYGLARPVARVYGYAPARPVARVYGYAPARPVASVYGYAPVYQAAPVDDLPHRDRQPLGTYAPSEPTNLSPPRAYFLGVERTAGGN